VSLIEFCVSVLTESKVISNWSIFNSGEF